MSAGTVRGKTFRGVVGAGNGSAIDFEDRVTVSEPGFRGRAPGAHRRDQRALADPIQPGAFGKLPRIGEGDISGSLSIAFSPPRL